jgi:hypothetical protein
LKDQSSFEIAMNAVFSYSYTFLILMAAQAIAAEICCLISPDRSVMATSLCLYEADTSIKRARFNLEGVAAL